MNKIGLISLSCLFIFKLYSVSCLESNNKNVLPLKFEQAISKLNADRLYFKSNERKEFISQLFEYKPSSEMLHDAFAKIAALDSFDMSLPNVNQLCSEQFINFTQELVKKTFWAIQG